MLVPKERSERYMKIRCTRIMILLSVLWSYNLGMKRTESCIENRMMLHSGNIFGENATNISRPSRGRTVDCERVMEIHTLKGFNTSRHELSTARKSSDIYSGKRDASPLVQTSVLNYGFLGACSG